MKDYLRTVALVLLVMSPVIVLQVTAKPTKPPPPKAEKPMTFPDLAGETIWGRLDLDKRTGYFTLTGHEQWTGEGQIITTGPAKGKVYLLWTFTANGRLAPGVYEIDKDNVLAGLWGYDDEVQVDDKEWTIRGAVNRDTVRKRE